MTDKIIPENYVSWRHCITVKCRLELTPEFIAMRLASLCNEQDAHTRELRRLYGETHYRNLIAWFVRAQRDSASS